MEKPKSKATQVQIAYLVKFMERHPEVAKGPGAGTLQSKLEVEKYWEALARKLNGMGGSIKTVTKWKQAWRDLKNNVKKKHRWPSTAGDESSTLVNYSNVDEQVMAVMESVANAEMNTAPVTKVEQEENSLSPIFFEQETCVFTPELPEPSKKITLRPKFNKFRRPVRPIGSYQSRMLRLKEEKLAIKKEKNLLKREKLNLAREKIGVLKRIADALEAVTEQLPK